MSVETPSAVTPSSVQVTVIGMTCRHCVMSVTEELSEIDGVGAVDVDLETGTVTLVTHRAVEREEIAAAITEAGFELARP